MHKSPTAISLERAIELSHWPIEITGCTSSVFLAWLISQKTYSAVPKLVVCHNEKSAETFCDDLLSFDPKLNPILLRAFDESPYSGLYPSSLVFKSRSHFLWRSLYAKSSDIFVASIEALLQKTLPTQIFKVYEVKIKKGDEVDISLLLKLLSECGYSPTPLVEDVGTFSKRGDILDIFSPSNDSPVRIEFFGDQIESLRLFEPSTQLSIEETSSFTIIPAREIIATDQFINQGIHNIKIFCDDHSIPKDLRDQLLAPIKQKVLSNGIDYWLGYFTDKPCLPLSAFATPPLTFLLDGLEVTRAADRLHEELNIKYREQINNQIPVPNPQTLYGNFEEFLALPNLKTVTLNNIHLESTLNSSSKIEVKCFNTSDFSTVVRAAREAKKDFFIPVASKLLQWKEEGLSCFIFSGTQTQAQRIQYLLESHGLSSHILDNEKDAWELCISAQKNIFSLVHIIPRSLSNSLRINSEEIVFLKDEDLFGSKTSKDHRKSKGTLEQRTNSLSFGDLNPGDLIVHSLHGLGIYEGLKKMPLQNIDAEFIQIKYRDNDKLYLPVYRIAQIQKYSASNSNPQIDKLGSTSWQKAKIKVKNELKEIAGELLSLYAKRHATPGFAFSAPDDDFREFEGSFPYDETPDQYKAIQDVLEDMQLSRPMDRLVCGDVGFGKTEVAIRAAYKCVQDKKQVALLVPTTVLAFQHFNNFTKRFKDVAVNISVLSRFTPAKDIKKILLSLTEGKTDIIIGTHRLLSKDISFKDLGLLIIDEEQKFGVTHKERIKKFKTLVDVLTLSATPIPRTLNMGLMGVRDLSLINTAPKDRLSIRTFINRFDEETIRKAILGEIQRGGQIYFIHNRVQSIYEFCEKIKTIVPEVKIRIGHGQMPDAELEKTMLDFYNHEFDVLLCTTIIESGLDIPRANTIIIDRADTFGLSQLYQLRGRVGRSKERAYAYLLIPSQGVIDKIAAERLKILQENTELGSGFQIAHHDLELRGSGNILGEDQSGHISAVGYELYMELLDQSLTEAKGEAIVDELEPDLNIRIPALIPDSYIEDIRIRLSYYKALTNIESEEDLDKLERELVDRFGPLPEQVGNLFGLMLIRKICKDIGVKDITLGPKNLSLIFSSSTKVKIDAVIRLATQDFKKYQLTPDQKLIIKFSSNTWMPILEELRHLKNIFL